MGWIMDRVGFNSISLFNGPFDGQQNIERSKRRAKICNV